MGKLSENTKTKNKCPYGTNGNLSCVCSYCERKRGCFNCLECKKNGEYKPVFDCDSIIEYGF